VTTKYALRLLASASGSIKDLEIMSLASPRSSGPYERIPSRERAIIEEKRGEMAQVGRMRSKNVDGLNFRNVRVAIPRGF
jgi:hypothetical protein